MSEDVKELPQRGDLPAELRERLKLKYMGDCKCGHCALVPDEMVARAADTVQLMLGALNEAEFFFSEDFPNGPDGSAIATPRYREAYRAILAAINKANGTKP